MSWKRKLGNDWGRLGMMSEWRTIRAADFIDFNPRLNLKKGAITTKVAMDKLKPFTKKIPETEKAEFNGGAKFCNGDTVMARITPCLENGKTAYVDMLDDGEIGFGSTEFIVMRAKAGISDPQFVYYTAINPTFRNVAIKSMVGSSGRQRVQQSVLEELELSVPGLDEQRRIGAFLAELDEKIALNNKINDNLHQQAATLFKALFVDLTPFDGTMPPNWTISTLGDATEMGAGGDKPKESSPVKTPLCPYPIYSNGINDYGLYGYTNDPKIKVESVTVSARGTIGYVCLRHTPYVPIVRLVTLIPDTKVLSAKYLYLYLRQLHITGTGTTQQQLTVPDFRKTEIIIPDKNTMDSFTETVTPLFEQIWANEDENTKLAEVRDALLPKLMSGEIDVSAVQL